MSKEKYIIGRKNSEPAPPEFVYFCGTKHPISTTAACVDADETVWDINPDCAEVFRSKSEVAGTYDNLMQLTSTPHNLFIQERIVSYNTLSTDEFMDIVVQNRINNILSAIDDDDIKYLKGKGVLDLTRVT